MTNRRRRNRCTLADLGYECYADYLASDVWADIRRRVLERSNYRCECCSCRATQVHHFRYCRSAMTGLNIESLVSLCRSCHEMGEFSGLRKNTHREANRIIFAAMYAKDQSNARRIAYAMHYQLPGQSPKPKRYRATRQERDERNAIKRAQRIEFYRSKQNRQRKGR